MMKIRAGPVTKYTWLQNWTAEGLDFQGLEGKKICNQIVARKGSVYIEKKFTRIFSRAWRQKIVGYIGYLVTILLYVLIYKGLRCNQNVTKKSHGLKNWLQIARKGVVE